MEENEKKLNYTAAQINDRLGKAGTALQDAPSDGKTYGRKDGAWVPAADDELAKKVDDLSSEMDDKFSIGGYDESARVGSANVLQPTAKSTTVEYEEKLPASRCIAYSPDNGSVGDAVNPMGQFAPVIREVTGDVVGGNQECNLKSPITKVFEDTSNYAVIIGKVGDWALKQGHSYIAITICDRNISLNSQCTLNFGGSTGQQSGDIQVLYNDDDNKVAMRVCVATDNGSYKNIVINNYSGKYGYSKGDSITVNQALLIDLTNLFPLDPTFVNSLGSNDTPKVLHRLAFTSLDINGSAITENADRLMRNGAEDIALVGYKKPQFDLTMPGKMVVIDSTKPCNTRNGVPATISREIDFRTTLRNAWSKLLDVLRERGIAIPDVALQPINLAASDEVRNILTSRTFEVKCWIKEGTEAAEGEIELDGLVIYPLAEPITIDLDQTINFSIGDCNGLDIIGLCDMDGNPMYDAEIEVDSNSKPTKIDLRWNKEWVETNKQFPATVGTFLQGMGLKVDYDTVVYLWEKVQELLNK